MVDADGKKYRHYTDKTGFQLKSTVVDSVKPFEDRIKRVSHPDYHTNAVGVASSMVYHGSETMEHDFVDKGVRGLRLAGNQFLCGLNLYNVDAAVGQRLGVKMMQPEALGSLLAKFAKLFEQDKFNHLKVVYKPLLSSLTQGGIGFWHQNDMDVDLNIVGESVLKQAATHQAFTDGNVWTAMSLDIKPSDTVKSYWSDSAGQFEDETQGLFQIIATGGLSAAQLVGEVGHFYLEYDITFWAPSLDNSVDDAFSGRFTWTTDAYVHTSSDEINAAGDLSAVGLSTFQWEDDGPSSFDVIAYGYVSEIVTSEPVSYYTDGNGATKVLSKGDGIAVAFSGDITAWDDNTALCTFYKNIGETETRLEKLRWATSSVISAIITFNLSTIDIGAGDEDD